MELRHPTVGPEIWERIVGCLVRRGAGKEDAEDAVQDALVALLQRGAAGDPVSAERWVRAVARRRLIDRYRHDHRCVAFSLPEPSQAPCSDHLESCSLTDLDGIAAQMSEPLRQTLRLLLEGSDADTVAGELGIGRWAAYKRIQRVRTYLKTHLTPANPPPRLTPAALAYLRERRAAAVRGDGNSGGESTLAHRAKRRSPCR